MGLVKSVTAVSGHQTKVKWEEVDLSACVCSHVCVLLILLMIYDFPMTVSLQFKHGGIQVHVDMRRCKQVNAL